MGSRVRVGSRVRGKKGASGQERERERARDIYIYIYADESMGGTHFEGLRVKQRDAPRLNNGTLHKIRGFGLFS